MFARERLLFAELKDDIGKLRPAQVACRDALRAAGAAWYLWRPSSWDEVQRVLV